MSSIWVNTSPLTADGLPALAWARNGVVPSAPGTRELAEYINFLLGYRLRVLASGSWTNADSPDFGAAGDNTTVRARSHVSPNATTVMIRMVLMRTETEGYTVPKGWWTITNKDTAAILYDDGTSGTDRSFIFDDRTGAPDTAVPDDYREVTRIYTGLTGGADYTFELHQYDGIRIQSFTIYENVRATLSTVDDTVIDSPKFTEGSPIYNRDVLDLLAALDVAWRQMGTNHLAWSINNTTAETMTGTMETNILDGTYTTNGWTSTSKGFYAQAKYHDSEDTRAASLYRVPVVLWAYASATVAGTGKVKFRTGTGSGDYIASIDAIAGAGWYTVTGYLNGSNASDKIDITGTGSDPSTLVSIYAAGCYERSS